MLKKIIFILLFFSESVLLSSQPAIKEPKYNKYSYDIEKVLISRGYTKINYDDFSAVDLFKTAYKKIYNKDYTAAIPTRVLNYHMDDGLYYSMLYDASEIDGAPLLTYLMFKDRKSVKCFYIVNWNREFSIIHWQGETLAGEISEEDFKVFY